MRLSRWGLGSVLGMALLLSGGPAQGQQVPFDPAVEIQLFDPALGPESLLTVESGEVAGQGQLRAGFFMTFLSRPFTVYTVENDEIVGDRTRVVESLLAGQLYGSYGLRDDVQLGAALPLVFSASGDGVDPNTAMPAAGGLSVTGLGDLRVAAAWRVWRKEHMAFTAIPVLTLPTSTSISDEDQWLGDDLPTFRPKAAFSWKSDDSRLMLAANVGFILRKPRQVYSSEIGQQLTYGGGARYEVHRRVDLLLETFGRKGLAADVDENPLEVDAGIRVAASQSLQIVAGGGAGLLQGIGSPDFRVFASLTWQPDFGDSDGDGIANMHDQCPDEKEDLDGFQDGDGCPDPDNDGDFVEDALDKCPNEAEDKDGFQDEDGCPEPDNDGDGIPDGADSCPDQAEDKLQPAPDDGCPLSARDTDGDGVSDDKDKCPDEEEDLDGFQDDDGCPDVDNDGDQVPDEFDACPTEAEDLDGFQDDDGCPEPDNDWDGILDADDRCPNEAEVINGVNDDDGCPDRGGDILAGYEAGRIAIYKEVKFRGDRMRRRDRATWEQVARHMRAHSEVTKWRIVVAAEKQASDEATRQLSQKRADTIKEFLIVNSVPADRIEALGAVSDTPAIVIVAVEKTERPEAAGSPEEPASDMQFETEE